MLSDQYTRFRVATRVLLTGHSHQAWPDVGFEGQQRAWLDAAELVDDKWERAAAQAGRVRSGFAALLHDEPENIALGQNTHELVTRWLSALPWRTRSRLVTTSGEFHTTRRQLDRLAEEGVDVVTVAARPVDGLAERLAAAADDRTLAVLVSSVLYETAEIVPGLEQLAVSCERHGVALLIDAYHHLNAVPFDVAAMGLATAFVTGGGYKYCQLGEGNAFLRVPPGCTMRPVLTGWFAEFDALGDAANVRRQAEGSGGFRLQAEGRAAGRVTYGRGTHAFAGATYDPTSHYRAAAVFDFHETQGLTAERLRAISVRQVAELEAAFLALDVDPALASVVAVAEQRRGGFLAIRTPHATSLVTGLRTRDVFVDARGDTLRAGPAPYVSDRQLRDGIAALGELLRTIGR